MAIPQVVMAEVKKRLDAYCHRGPLHARGVARYRWRVRGNLITLSEQRTNWQGLPGEVMTHEFARFQYDPTEGHWALRWRDGKGRFHPYEGFESVPSIDSLVDEVEADPTHMFLG